jgi:hypothetical protein
MDCGRFLRSDSYTTARDRLDYARVLISTTALAVVKKVEQLLVDGSLVEIQIIEEWGFDLGDDACLLEDDAASEVSIDADDESHGDPEASNQAAMLVDQIAKEVADAQCNGSHHQGDATHSVKTHMLSHVKRSGTRDHGFGNTVLEPVVVSSASSGVSIERVAETEMTAQKYSTRKTEEVLPPPTTAKAGLRTDQRKRTLSCPPANRSRMSGPWSLEWLRDHTIGGAEVLSARRCSKQGVMRMRLSIKGRLENHLKRKWGASSATRCTASKGLHDFQLMTAGRCCTFYRKMPGDVGPEG